MRRATRSILGGVLALTCATVIVIAPTTHDRVAFAATATWTGGGGDANWSTAANWGGSAPSAGDDLVFPNGIGSTTTNDFASGTSFGSITVGPDYTLTGNPITLQGGITEPIGSGTAIVDLDIAMAGTSTFDVASGGTLHLGGAISGAGGMVKTSGGALILAGANSYTGATSVNAGWVDANTGNALGTAAGDTTVASGAMVRFDGATLMAEPFDLSGTGVTGLGALVSVTDTVLLGGAITLSADTSIGALDGTGIWFTGAIDDVAGTFDLSIVAGNTGRVILGANPDFAGDITGTSGYLRATDATSFGDPAVASTVTLSDTATLELTALTAPATKTFNLSLNGANGGVDSKVKAVSGTSTLPAVVFQGNEEIDVASGSMLTITGAITQTGSNRNLLKAGAGTLVLGGTNSYTGGTFVSGGTLRVNGSIAASSQAQVSDATIGGSGTLPATISINNGGTLAPGNSPGIVSTGSLTLTSGSTYAVELNGTTVGTQYDQTNVTGTVSIGGSLSISLGFTPASGDQFTIIANDGVDAITGTFSGLAEGSTMTVGPTTLRISYVGGSGNDVVLTTLEATTTTVTSSDLSTTLGDSVTFTATVTPTAGASGGSVNFYDGATLLATATLDSSGEATLSTSGLSVGTHSIHAVYLGQGNSLSSTSASISQVVAQLTTTTGVAASPNPSTVGQSVTLTATVSVVAPGSGTPTGVVAFLDGATLIATAALSGGVATLTTSALSLGTHSITAVYGGVTDFAGSTSSAQSVAVNAVPTTTTTTTTTTTAAPTTTEPAAPTTTVPTATTTSPTTIVATTTTLPDSAAPQLPTGPNDVLPATGNDSTWQLLVSCLLVVIGVAVTRISRRRIRSH